MQVLTIEQTSEVSGGVPSAGQVAQGAFGGAITGALTGARTGTILGVVGFTVFGAAVGAAVVVIGGTLMR